MDLFKCGIESCSAMQNFAGGDNCLGISTDRIDVGKTSVNPQAYWRFWLSHQDKMQAKQVQCFPQEALLGRSTRPFWPPPKKKFHQTNATDKVEVVG
jgi:hypothetical protein